MSLPAGWRTVRLDEVAEIRAGRTPKNLEQYLAANPRIDRAVPFFKVGDMNSNANILRTARTYLASDELAQLGLKIHPHNCIVFPKAGGAIATNKKRRLGIAGALDLNCMGVIPGSTLEPNYLLFWFESLDLSNIADGSVMPQISKGRVAELRIPIPPLSRQQEIADLLDTHCSHLDKAETLLIAAQSRLSKLAQSTIDNAFWSAENISSDEIQGPDVAASMHAERRAIATAKMRDRHYEEPSRPDSDLGQEQPPPWPTISLEEATDPVRIVRYGILKPRVNGGGSIRYVEVKDLAGDSLIGKQLHLTTNALDEQFSGARIAAGDVVIAVRGSYERVALVPDDLSGANISRDVARLAPIPSIDPRFLFFWLKTTTSKSYLRRNARGVAVKGVNISALRNLPLPCLHRNMQLRIVQNIRQQLQALENIEITVQNSAIRLIRLRRALLEAAFSGRLTGRASDMDLVEEMAGV